jgi:hypothetical protein
MTPLLPLLLLGALSGDAVTQTPAPSTQPAPQTAPAAKPAAPRPRPTTPPSGATATLTVNVTDGGGLPLQGVDVRASGALDREGSSLATGFVRFLNLRGGDYRLRFAHPKFVLLERDVTVRPGVSQTIDVMLSPAPVAEPPVERVAPAPLSSANTAPPGDPASAAIPDFIEKNFIGGRDPLKESPLGCTASAKTTLVQVNTELPERALPDADETILVVYGEGTLRLGNRDVTLSSKALSLAVIPRGTVRGVTRKGRNPLIFVSVLSGPPCTR